MECRGQSRKGSRFWSQPALLTSPLHHATATPFSPSGSPPIYFSLSFVVSCSFPIRVIRAIHGYFCAFPPFPVSRLLPHDSPHDFLTTCFQNPPLKNQWILPLFKIRTSIPAGIFKGFTTQKCKIPQFHRGVHGFTTLAPQGGVRGSSCSSSSSSSSSIPFQLILRICAQGSSFKVRSSRFLPPPFPRSHASPPPTAASPPLTAAFSPPQPPLTAVYCRSPQPARHLTAPNGSYRHLSAPK